jgi:hypothetical protein
LLGRPVPVVRSTEGFRAINKGKPCNPAQAEKYLSGKFGARFDNARQAMAELEAAFEPGDLNRRGFRLYEAFRPGVPAGESGWGALGELELEKVRALAGRLVRGATPWNRASLTHCVRNAPQRMFSALASARPLSAPGCNFRNGLTV